MFISDNWLVNTPGYQKVIQLLASGEGRVVYSSTRGKIMIAVVGSLVYQISAQFVVTYIGMLTTQTGEVFVDENLNAQICLVDGVNVYIYNYSLGYPNLTIQTGLGNLIPNYVSFHNTYFLFGNANTTSNGAAWYAYQFSTETTIVQATPGQFALQTKPDFALAVVRLPGQSANVLVLGSTVCEIWTQVGGLQNYQRNSTINVDYGCVSVSTISDSDNFVAWLGINEKNAPVIMTYTGQGFTRISTDGIAYQLDQIKYPMQSTGMFFRQDGHLFYQLTFYNEADNLTLIYDFNTQKFFNLSDANLDYHPARNYVYFQGETYFISLNTASLYISATDYTTYNENLQTGPKNPALNLEIPRIRICDTIRAEDSAQFRANSFVFTMEQGEDLNVTGASLLGLDQLMITENFTNPPQAVMLTEWGVEMAEEGFSDEPIPYQPRVDMTLSRDGGVTWSNTVSRLLNPAGERMNIVNWEGMGLCNALTYKLRFWGLSRFVVSNGFTDIY